MAIVSLNGSSIDFFSQYEQADFHPDRLPVLAFHVMAAELPYLSDFAAGHYLSAPYVRSLETSENQAFLEAWQTWYPTSSLPCEETIAAYDCIFLWKQAVESAGGFATAAVRAAACGQTFASAAGIARVAANQHLEKTCYLARIAGEDAWQMLPDCTAIANPQPWLDAKNRSDRPERMLALLSEVCNWMGKATVQEHLEMQDVCVIPPTCSLLDGDLALRRAFASTTEFALRRSQPDAPSEIVSSSLGLLAEPPSELAGKHLHDIFEPAVAEAIEQQIGFCLQTSRAINIEYSLSVRGAERWFAASVAPLSSQELLWLARDITAVKLAKDTLQRTKSELERQVTERTAALQATNDQLIAEVVERTLAENALRTSQDRFQAILDAVPGIVSWIGSDFRYLGVNHRLAGLFNLSPENFVGRDIGFLGSSSEFNDFVREFFASPKLESAREVFARVRGEERSYLIVTRKYDRDRAAFFLGIDITERRRAEKDLEQTKNQLEAILEAVPGIVSWIDADLCYLGVNRQLASIFGLAPQDFVGRDIGFLGGSDFTQFARDFFASDRTEQMQEMSSRANGEDRHYLIVAQKYEEGRAAFLVGIDVTARVRVEEALRRAEEKYRDIYENTIEGIFQTSQDGRFLSANPALARIYGYDSPEELIASLTDLDLHLYADPNRRNEFVRLIAREDRVQNFESQVRRRDGSLTWISENARAVRDESGNILYYEGTVEDIRQRKEAEEALQRANEELEARVRSRTAELVESNNWLRVEVSERKRIEAALRQTEAKYRSIFEHATEGIYQTTAEGAYLSANPALAEIYGYASPEELMAEMTDIAGQLYVDPDCRNRFVRALEDRDAIANFEAEVWRKDGTKIFTSENARAVRDDDGNLLFYEGTVEDITAQRQAEEELKVEREKADRLLCNILPHAIAQKLKESEGSLADRFDAATVLFADLVGFTAFAAGVSPFELVSILNQIFTTFDRLADRHGLEKIKTIGDAYMVAGGLPIPRDDHAEAVAEMALDMQQEIDCFRTPTGHRFQLRIGIHTGPVVAGVIGIRKFTYDLWGDTVNTASRMESHGVTGAIQVTQATYDRIKHRYMFEDRGTIAVRGKGHMSAYLLRGRNPSERRRNQIG